MVQLLKFGNRQAPQSKKKIPCSENKSYYFYCLMISTHPVSDAKKIKKDVLLS